MKGDPAEVGASVLQADTVSKQFAGVSALRDVDLSVTPGRFLGLIGPNGSGKSTLVNVLSGFSRPTAGRVTVGGRNVSGWPPYRIARLGIGRTFQHTRLFGRLTALENVEVGAIRARRRMTGRQRRVRARAALEEMRVSQYADYAAADLSFGTQRKVELARALATEPSLLMLDEPAAGVPEVERGALRTTIAQAASQRGLGVLVIDHDLSFVTALCQQIVVLDAGSVIARGTPQEITEDPAVIEAYIGVRAADGGSSQPETWIPGGERKEGR